MNSRRFHPQWRLHRSALLLRGLCPCDAPPIAKADPGAAPPSPAQEQVSRDFQKTLSLGAGQKLLDRK